MTRLLQLTVLALSLPVIALCVLLADEDEPFADMDEPDEILTGKAQAFALALASGCCNVTIDCSADTDREACDDIDAYLEPAYTFLCAACRAMPGGPKPKHLDPAA